jgi:toxin CcdB
VGSASTPPRASAADPSTSRPKSRSLGLSLDPDDARSLYQQLFDEIVSRISTSAFPPGFRLPPTRQLSEELDVHRNTGRQRDSIPFVVVVQSALYDDYRRRVVVPLVRRDRLGPVADPGFNPAFTLEGTEVILHPLEIVSVPMEQLGERVDSLASAGDAIVQALDQLLSRAWG